MATRRNYQESNTRFIPWLMVGLLLGIIALGIGLVRFRPDLILGTAANDAAKAADQARATLSATGIQRAQQAAPATDQEQQVLRQAAPKDDTSKPPALPVEATAAAVAQPSTLDEAPASSLSPVDLTYRPVPTPTTMLTQAQFDASQASEEVNQLNTMQSGLTPAQRMVQEHEAEYQASNP